MFITPYFDNVKRDKVGMMVEDVYCPTVEGKRNEGRFWVQTHPLKKINH